MTIKTPNDALDTFATTSPMDDSLSIQSKHSFQK